jgi:FAD:protein FMN transferase
MAGDDDLVRRAQPWFGTIVEIAVPVGQEAAIEAGFARIRHVHERMSYHDASSDLHWLREARIGMAVRVDPETIHVLKFALQLQQETDGLFDVTVGRHLAATQFLPMRGPYDLDEVVGRGTDIEIIRGSHVRCHAPLLIDLGGIAKGHGVDLAVTALIAAGCNHGIVNAGGDLRVFGDVAQPIWFNRADGSLSEPIALANAAVATSANLHNRRRSGARVMTPHIGRSGTPVIADHAVSVIAPTCMIADAMTKVAMADLTLAAKLLAQYGAQMIITERCAA